MIGVFLMRQFFITMPDAVLEAARVDGASEWQLFARVAMPLARPALAVLAVFAFQHYWTDFFWPLVIVQSPRLLTLQVGLVSLARSEFGPQLGRSWPPGPSPLPCRCWPSLFVFCAAIFLRVSAPGALQ